jgi:hypothetical protein
MKNLDLNKYGVQEMNAKEMRKTEGGKASLADFMLWVADWYIPHAQKHPDMSETLMNCM